MRLAWPEVYGHNSLMEQVTISELKNRLSAYIKKVRAGQTIVVLDRDQPVARLEAVGDSASADERLARLERQGILRRGSGQLSIEKFREGLPRTDSGVVEALLEERGEAR